MSSNCPVKRCQLSQRCYLRNPSLQSLRYSVGWIRTAACTKITNLGNYSSEMRAVMTFTAAVCIHLYNQDLNISLISNRFQNLVSACLVTSTLPVVYNILHWGLELFQWKQLPAMVGHMVDQSCDWPKRHFTVTREFPPDWRQPPSSLWSLQYLD